MGVDRLRFETTSHYRFQCYSPLVCGQLRALPFIRSSLGWFAIYFTPCWKRL